VRRSELQIVNWDPVFDPILREVVPGRDHTILGQSRDSIQREFNSVAYSKSGIKRVLEQAVE